MKPAYPEALINLAALHHRFGLISEAVRHYEEALNSLAKDGHPDRDNLTIMLRNNLGVAQVQVCPL